MLTLESVQLVSRLKDSNLVSLNYWEKFKELRLYFQQRRRERYMIIFSGYNVQFVSYGTRRGKSTVPNPIVKSAPTLAIGMPGRGPWA